MTGWIEKTDKWRDIFGELIEEGVYEMGPVNYYRLASILEDLYVENQELKDRVEALETQIKDLQKITVPQDYRNNLGL